MTIKCIAAALLTTALLTGTAAAQNRRLDQRSPRSLHSGASSEVWPARW